MPTRHIVSASSLGRLVKCPASVALPAVHTTSVYAETGTVIHDYLHALREGLTVDQALSRVPEELRTRCLGISSEVLGLDLEDARGERAYAINIVERTVRPLGQNIGRAYDVGPSEIPGTMDVLGVNAMSGMPVVIEYKTGQRVTSAKSNEQTLFGAAVALRLYGAEECEVRIIYIDEVGKHFIDSHIHDVFAVDDYLDGVQRAHSEALEAIAHVANGRTPNVSMGDWCNYCPALYACPAHVSLARAAATELDTIATRIAALTPEEGGKAWNLNKRIRVMSDKIDEGLKALAKRAPLPISDTLEVRATEPQARTSYKTEKLVALAKCKGATDDEIETCKTQSTFISVREMKRK